MTSTSLSLGAALKRLRKASGLTQRELADRLEVDATYVSHLEADRKEPSVDLLRKLAGTLDVPLPLLLATLLSTEVPDDALRAYDQIVSRLWRLHEKAARREPRDSR